MRRRSPHRRLAGLGGVEHSATIRTWLRRRTRDLLWELSQRRRGGQALAFAVAAVSGWVVGGPVAAVVFGVYAVLGASAWYARLARRRSDLAARQAVETVEILAAELRAGLPLPARVEFADADAALRFAAARQISERLGAPLADLLDKVENDLCSTRRIRANAVASMAGSQATAGLLAVLPAVGIALGSGLGADPLHQLLHTPTGAACALAALALQTAGILLTSRLTRSVMAEFQPCPNG